MYYEVLRFKGRVCVLEDFELKRLILEKGLKLCSKVVVVGAALRFVN